MAALRLALALALPLAAATKGVVMLDDLTFDKVRQCAQRERQCRGSLSQAWLRTHPGHR